MVYTPQSRDTLNSTAKQIEETAHLLRAIGQQMDDEKFALLHVGNHDQLLRAMEYLDNFAAAARDALRKARKDRGDFVAISAIDGKSKKSPK